MDQLIKMNTTPVSVEVDDDGNFIFKGYASTFLSEPDSYGDIIDPSAFDESIEKLKTSESPLPMLFQHDWKEVIGHFTTIIKNDVGIYVEGKIVAGVQRGEETVKLLNAGSFGSLSIGYHLEQYVDNQDGTFLLTKIDLLEVSVVVVPANTLALIDKIKSKSSDDKDINIKNLENLLRDVVGVSRKKSKILISEMKQKEQQRDAERNELKQLSEKIDKILNEF